MHGCTGRDLANGAVALVGLGRYSHGQLRPGLRITEQCELKGIVTGSPGKIPDGWYRLSPSLSYSGVRGKTSDGTQLPPDPNHQQARQMNNDALAINEGRPPIVPGEEGLADVRFVKAIMESSRRGGDRVEV